MKQWFFSSENMIRTAIKILQGSAVTQNLLDESIIYRLLANFLQCMSVQNYEDQMKS